MGIAKNLMGFTCLSPPKASVVVFVAVLAHSQFVVDVVVIVVFLFCFGILRLQQGEVVAHEI